MSEKTLNIDELRSAVTDFDSLHASQYPQIITDYFRYYGIDFESQFSGLQHFFGAIDCGAYRITSHYFSLAGKPASKTVLIVHGYYDHVGLYKHAIANSLAQGYNVVAFDLPGHGLSSGERSCIVRFGEYQLVLKAIIAYFEKINIPIAALIGQSTGAAIVMQYLLEHPQQNRAAVMLAPLLKVYQWRSSRLLYRLVKNFIKRLPRRFANNSHDKNFIYFLKYQDPLQSKYTHLDWVGALIEWVEEFKYFKATRHKVLIVQGLADSTVDWRINIPAINKKLPCAKIGYIDGAGHQLVNETEVMRQQVFILINQYLSEHS
ncbi:alpha/beta hydrolase [Dasania marina]|uniref:alpha/beta hydrolase n=1 Tax=Dasania marina TaxID=471499 RepID=UPI0030DABEC1